MALEPMQGNWASSRVDLGYRELFCPPAVTSGSLKTCDSVLEDSLECHQGSQGSFQVWCGIQNCSAWNAEESGLAASGKSHGFSRIAAGTWGIFSSEDGNGLSKLVFLQQCQDSCLVARDTSRLSQRLGSAIGMLLKVRWETQVPFPVATVILGFLSIFKRSQASSPFEALNSACLTSCQRDVGPPVAMKWRTRAFSRVPKGTQTSLHLLRWKTSLHSSHCREFRPYFELGHPGVHSNWGSKLRVPLTYL